MEPLPAWAVPASGGLIGCAIGYAARRGRLCTFGALEDAFLARNFRRLKVLALALGIAIAITQTLIIQGALPPEAIRYLPTRLALISIALGGLIFGFGMALVGTCAFGSLIRLGGGDLRSFITILVYAVAALATLRGGLASLRLSWLESQNIALPGNIQSDLAALVSWVANTDLRIAITILSVAALAGWALSRRDILDTPRLLFAGVVIGVAVAAAWLMTGVLVDDLSLIVEPEGLTFVAPVADALQGISMADQTLWSFGVCSVFGVVLGAFLASRFHDDFHWEAYDDHREMKRHMAGGILMGLGGVLAGGCTIGQGLTAGSVLALSWFPAVCCMAIGARLGLYFLMSDIHLKDILPMMGHR
jgi:uncharacterized membrane protein YedE/YeeE